MKFRVIQSQPTYHVVDVIGPPGVTGRLKIATEKETVGFEHGHEFTVKGALEAGVKEGKFVHRVKGEAEEEG